MAKVTLKDIPAIFYVGPVGVLVVAEHPAIAQEQARRVFEDSGGTIPALPVVLDPRLKEPQGRVEGVLALRDEEAIKDYLRGKRLLSDHEIDLVAAWLADRTLPVPPIRDKKEGYRSEGACFPEGEHLAERTEAPPALAVEPGPPPAPVGPGPPVVLNISVVVSVHESPSGKRPRKGPVALPRKRTPSPLRRVAAVAKGLSWRVAKGLSWRAAFLPELAIFALMALLESPWAWLLVAVLGVRFLALFGDDPLSWKRWMLLSVGALELGFVWEAVGDKVQRGTLSLWDWFWMAILVPGLLSLFRGIWLFWPGRKPSRVYPPRKNRLN